MQLAFVLVFFFVLLNTVYDTRITFSLAYLFMFGIVCIFYVFWFVAAYFSLFFVVVSLLEFFVAYNDVYTKIQLFVMVLVWVRLLNITYKRFIVGILVYTWHILRILYCR